MPNFVDFLYLDITLQKYMSNVVENNKVQCVLGHRNSGQAYQGKGSNWDLFSNQYLFQEHEKNPLSFKMGMMIHS